MKKRGIITGSLVLGVGAFLAKLLGAIYRIPLTKLLGGEGLGLYQMIFPVYIVLLDFSGAGLPNALSKLVAENKERGTQYLKVSIKYFGIIGLVGSILMAFLSKPFSILQGNENAYLGYIFLSPAIFFVSLLSCYRGYYQGLLKMTPTAISQIIEQTIKLVFGLFFVYLFLPNLPLAVGGATLGIAISEVIAFVYLFLLSKRVKNKNYVNQYLEKEERKNIIKRLLRYVIPVTLLGVMLPLSQVVDSFLAINMMKKYTPKATILYGLLSGVAVTVVSLPVSICYGVSTVAVPSVSKSKMQMDKEKNATYTLLLTFILSLPCMVICYIFAPNIIGLLFASLRGNEKWIAISLLRMISPAILLLSLIQTQNAIFIGLSKPIVPIITLGLGVTLKIVIESVLYQNARFNIYGGAIALIACYFFITLVNLIIMIKLKVQNENSATIYQRRAV